MSSEIVQLPQRDTSIHGRRYTDEERAAWYLYWRIMAGKSCRKVAQRFNVDDRTIRSCRDEYDWIARAAEEDQDDFASAHIGLSALVINEYIPNFETAREIRDDRTNSARDRLMAVQWMSGLGGVSAVTKIEQAVVQAPVTRVDIIDVQDLAGKSPDELQRLYDHHRGKRDTSPDRRGQRR